MPATLPPRMQRAVKSDGTVVTIAGTGMDANSGDGGPATSASLSNPGSLFVTSTGTIYVGLLGCVRKFTRGGAISKVAGSCGSYYSDSGDGGQATSASMTNVLQYSYPRGLAVDEGRCVCTCDRVRFRHDESHALSLANCHATAAGRAATGSTSRASTACAA